MKSWHGGVAQLGEHLPCTQGVRSSILLISTTRLSLEADRDGRREDLEIRLRGGRSEKPKGGEGIGETNADGESNMGA